MAVNVPYTDAALVAAVREWRRRNVVAWFEREIKKIEDYLLVFPDLPMLDRCAGPPRTEIGDFDEWYDGWGFPRKVLGRPCISRSGLERDRVLDELRAFFGMEGASDSETSAAFMKLVNQVQQLRSRGYLCGAISRGIGPAPAEEITGGDPLGLLLAQGPDCAAAVELGWAVSQTLVTAVRPEDLDFLATVYSRMAHEGVADGEFRCLLTDHPEVDLTPLDILMAGRWRPKQLNWQSLVACALGLIANEPPEPASYDAVLIPYRSLEQRYADLAA